MNYFFSFAVFYFLFVDYDMAYFSLYETVDRISNILIPRFSKTFVLGFINTDIGRT